MSNPRYWITVHYPQREYEEFLPHVYLQDGLEEVARDLRPQDLAFLYETASAPVTLKQTAEGLRRRPIAARGRQGIVALVRLTSALYDRKNTPTLHASGKQVWWRWRADAEIVSREGFVPRADVNEILGHKKNWNWRGFGDRRSGLRQIGEEQFREIRRRFEAGAVAVNLAGEDQKP